MDCSACHHANPPGLKFCGECGVKLVLQCASCGASNAPTQKFCGECGAKLVVDSSKGASPESYTPKHLAEKILTSRAALEGERKQVTVLFCDIAGSTALAERLGEEPMHALLNRFFDLAVAEVHRYEGTINQFLGDGFMALFGAPVAHEDHARRAVLAALDIQRSLSEADSDLDQVKLRMGLNTGPVVVGKIGDNLRMDYTAVGDTTNVAARLQQSAEPGTILISAATEKLARGFMRTEAIAPMTVKGKRDPLAGFRVLGQGTRRSRLNLRDEQALCRFVGRGKALSVPEDVLADVQSGQGRLAGVVGDSVRCQMRQHPRP